MKTLYFQFEKRRIIAVSDCRNPYMLIGSATTIIVLARATLEFEKTSYMGRRAMISF
jgi:hypothetical protein